MTKEDRELPLNQVPARFCPRKLKHGQCKRYMTVGPLIAYVLACPACGFIEMHQHDQARFVEENGKLVSASHAVSCMACRRTIVIEGGVAKATAGQASRPAVA